MSFYNFVYTAPFPKDTKMTKAQVFEALRAKACDPVKFVPVIVWCEVLEATPTFIKRTMTTRDGTTIVGYIDLYAPSFVGPTMIPSSDSLTNKPSAQVTFKGSNRALVINSVAGDNEGHMSLTFSFSFPVPNESEEETAKKRELYKIGKDAVDKSVVTTLEMFGAGKLQ